MKDFEGKVAVVTGAASGIGRGIAVRCAQERMKVVLADVEAEALADARREIGTLGAPVLAVQTDVSDAGQVDTLAAKTYAAFGAVHLLVNTAGVAAGSTVWDSTLNDWQWVLGVNLWGVIHTVRAFVPTMLAQDADGYIVNTSAVAGLAAYNPFAPYMVSKHGVVALSEQMYYSLKQRQSRVGVSVLCPGFVKSRILSCDRNRPAALRNPPSTEPPDPEQAALWQANEQALAQGMLPATVAERVFAAIRAERFYILTHPEFNRWIENRKAGILELGHPLLD